METPRRGPARSPYQGPDVSIFSSSGSCLFRLRHSSILSSFIVVLSAVLLSSFTLSLRISWISSQYCILHKRGAETKSNVIPTTWVLCIHQSVLGGRTKCLHHGGPLEIESPVKSKLIVSTTLEHVVLSCIHTLIRFSSSPGAILYVAY